MQLKSLVRDFVETGFKRLFLIRTIRKWLLLLHATISTRAVWSTKRLALVRQTKLSTSHTDSPWGNATLLCGTLLRFTAHWSSSNSSKMTASICWANRMRGKLCTLLPLPPVELTLMCRDRRMTPPPEETTTGRGTGVTQFLASFSVFLLYPSLYSHLIVLLRKCGSFGKQSAVPHFHWFVISL